MWWHLIQNQHITIQKWNLVSSPLNVWLAHFLFKAFQDKDCKQRLLCGTFTHVLKVFTAIQTYTWKPNTFSRLVRLPEITWLHGTGQFGLVVQIIKMDGIYFWISPKTAKIFWVMPLAIQIANKLVMYFFALAHDTHSTSSTENHGLHSYTEVESCLCNIFLGYILHPLYIFQQISTSFSTVQLAQKINSMKDNYPSWRFTHYNE
jgi:hypothetical protein